MTVGWLGSTVMLFCAADPATQVASALAAFAFSIETLKVVNTDATIASKVM